MNGASNQSIEHTATKRVIDSLHTDGNAAAGMLSEIFALDLTAGRAKCVGCGDTRAIGELHLYSHGMGMVMRCPTCDAVVLRMARTPDHIWLDARGATAIVISGQS